MTSIGRVARWDRDRPLRTDRGVLEMRQRLKSAYAKERAEGSSRRPPPTLAP
jgi:hypothetical protein